MNVESSHGCVMMWVEQPLDVCSKKFVHHEDGFVLR